MAQDYTQYLAINVLSEQQYVNYRNLGRALKVHSNIAKQMLYDFHCKQNLKKPGSVHATYLLSGTKKSASTSLSQSIDDVESSMNSSPPMPSSSFPRTQEQYDVEKPIPVRSVMLVKEEDLAQAKAQFETVSGLHVYSLQVNGVSDVQVLTECNRRVQVEYATEDPLKEWGKYGVVQNEGVRRRERGRGAPPPRPIAAKAAKNMAAAAKSTVVEKQAEKPAAKNAPPPPPPQKSTATTAKPAASKNQNSSLFKSFAKGSANAKKKAESAESSAAPSPAAEVEDVPMTGFSDDDDDDADSGLPAELEAVKIPAGESKSERKFRLEAMMDEEDEGMEDAAPAEEEDHGAIDVEEKEEPKESVVVENGRRRGRRRVMKKKTVKDADGYLVTREEAVWEEFSEDEPAPKKAKVSSNAGSGIKAAAAAKKGGGGKPGQGNIMSFFSKK